MSSDLAVQSTLAQFAAAFDAFLATKIIPYVQRTAPAPLSLAMSYALSTPGKRIRPALLLWCAGVEPEPAQSPSAFYVAAAVESIHTYSLIHDDLPAMDDDAWRRGRPACHIQYSEWAAILAGDGLNSFAFELLAKAVELEPEWSLQTLIFSLSRGAGMGGMIAGQALDLNAERNPSERSLDPSWLVTEIHNKKTAALFSTCCELGAILAHCADLAPYRDYGRKLGLLFQIKDDLLDTSGDPRTMGKAVGKDIGKLTWPAVFGPEETQRRCELLQQELVELAQKLKTGLRSQRSYTSELEQLPAFILRREA